jgi:hypothetical protein
VDKILPLKSDSRKDFIVLTPAGAEAPGINTVEI